MEIVDIDVLVLGSEPAGIWLLNQLHEISVGTLRLAVVCDSLQRPNVFSKAVCEKFALAAEPLGNPVLITPQARFAWNTDFFARSSLPLTSCVSQLLEGELLSEKLYGPVLREKPEWLSCAKGLSQFLSRANTSTTASTLGLSLLSFELSIFRPASHLLPSIPVESLVTEKITGLIRNDRGEFELRLNDNKVITTKILIVNEEWVRLQKWLTNLPGEKGAVLPPSDTFGQGSSLFPLTLTVDPDLFPRGVTPFLVQFQEFEVPDALADIQTMTLEDSPEGCELTIWVEVNRPCSLEGVLDRMRHALGLLYRTFPASPRAVRSIRPTLGMMDCYGDGVRQEAWEDLQSCSIGKARDCLSSYRTANPNLYWLSTTLRSDLPQPLGGLLAAKSLVPELIKRFPAARAAKKAKEAASPASPPRPNA